MKKIILLAFTAVVISFAAHAQIEKGTILLGGDVGFSSSKSESTTSSSNDKNKNTNISFTPAVGIAVKPNTVLGIQIGYSHSKNAIEPNAGTQEYSNYVSRIFIRRYLTLGKGFYLFAQPGIYYNNGKYEARYPTGDQTNNSWETGINLYPGFSYAVNKRFQLEAGLGNIANIYYRHSKQENKLNPSGETAHSKGNNFIFSSSLSNSEPISIGFRFFL